MEDDAWLVKLFGCSEVDLFVEANDANEVVEEEEEAFPSFDYTQTNKHKQTNKHVFVSN